MIRNDRFRLRLKCAQVSAVHTEYPPLSLSLPLSFQLTTKIVEIVAVEFVI